MSNSSQSRQGFSLQWLDRSQTWLDQLEPMISSSWNWLVSHHQLLTLAKRAERQVGLSVLWFTVTGDTKAVVAFGARLPGNRVALICGIRKQGPWFAIDGIEAIDATDAIEFSTFLRSKMPMKTVMGTDSDLKILGFVSDRLDPDKIIERQQSWGKRLATARTERDIDSGDTAASTALASRRAGETDRALLNRWAKLFASETSASAEGTEREVAEWMKRGRLLIFETPAPSSRAIAMAALSGDFTDRKSGRSCRFSLLFVDPVHRGRGYGRLAIQALEHEARLENANGLVLYSDATNARLTHFYSDLGFKISDEWLEVEDDFSVSTTG